MQPGTVSVPLEQFSAIAPLVQENEQASGEDVFAKLVADNGGQAIMGLAEVDRLTAQKDPGRGRQA